VILRLVEVVVAVAVVDDIAFVGCPFERQEEMVNASEWTMFGLWTYLVDDP